MHAGERPTEQVDSLLSPSRIAHEAIYEIYSELATVGRESPTARELLRESAQMVLREAPEVVAQSRRLAAQWEQQNLLGPDAALETFSRFAEELERVKPKIWRVRDRQREIAVLLRSMLES